MSERIPREFIQVLLSRIEIVDLIDARVPLKKKSGNNYFACCPFHTEKSASFSVSQHKQFYHCFGCGAHGNAIDFLMQYDRLEFPEAIRLLAKQLGIEVPQESHHTDKVVTYGNLYELLENINAYYQQQLRQQHKAISYLKQRNVTGQIAKQFAVGYSPSGWDNLSIAFGKSKVLKQQLIDSGMLVTKEDGKSYDRFRDRLMFPIHDRKGRIVGFGGRVFDKSEPKYLNSPETPIFQKGHELYGLYHVLKVHRQLKRVLIVEGYMDVIALFQHDITYAVATLGTATTTHHLQRLFRYTNDIIFCFDGDSAGRGAAWRALLSALAVITDGIQVKFMFLPDGEDPDSLVRKEGKEVFEKRIQSAEKIEDFFFQSVATDIDLLSTDGRARFIKLAMEHLDKLPSGMFQQMMIAELARRTRISPDQLTVKKAQGSPKSPIQKARSPSALRLVLSLLVQNPQLAGAVAHPLPNLDLQGYPLLLELMEFIKNQSDNLTTGALLEFWRDKEDGKILAKLAQIEHMTPSTGLQSEFLGAIEQLKKIARKQAIDRMLAKASQAGLSLEEKQQLNELIQTN